MNNTVDTPKWMLVADWLYCYDIKEFGEANLSNPVIIAMFKALGYHDINSDETPWCAAFVGYCLLASGYLAPRSLLARSYLAYGAVIEFNDLVEGDIVIFKRGSNPESGHVGFYNGYMDGPSITVLGGNQSDKVCFAAYPIKNILGIRRPILDNGIKAK